MQDFFNKIKAECDKQDVKWGSDRNLHPLEWVSILSEEVGEVSKEINDAGFRTENIFLENYEKELVQVAAVACQMLKNIKHYKELQMSASNLIDIEKIIKNKQPIAEMAKKRLEKERGGNISLWVDDEQTEYWTEIYSMGVEDERYGRLSEN